MKEMTMSNATKYDQGKENMALLPTIPLLKITKVYEYGAKKYGTHNWRRGMDWSRLVSATFRHLSAWNEGEQNDPESGLPHLAHAACNLMFLLEYESKKLGNDDRFKTQIKQIIGCDGKDCDCKSYEPTSGAL